MTMPSLTPNEPQSQMVDVGAITLWLASLTDMLPSIAAVLSILWFLIRLLESETFQMMLGKYRWIIKSEKDDHAKD